MRGMRSVARRMVWPSPGRAETRPPSPTNRCGRGGTHQRRSSPGPPRANCRAESGGIPHRIARLNAVEAPNGAPVAPCRDLPLLERRIHPLRRVRVTQDCAQYAESSAPQPSPSLFWGRVGEYCEPGWGPPWSPPAHTGAIRLMQVKSPRLFGGTFRRCCGGFIRSAGPRASTGPLARAGAASRQYREAFSRCCGGFSRSAGVHDAPGA